MDQVTDTPLTTLTSIYKEEGVVDLSPLQVRMNFARALKAERSGNNAEAERFLGMAVELDAATRHISL